MYVGYIGFDQLAGSRLVPVPGYCSTVRSYCAGINRAVEAGLSRTAVCPNGQRDCLLFERSRVRLLVHADFFATFFSSLS